MSFLLGAWFGATFGALAMVVVASASCRGEEPLEAEYVDEGRSSTGLR